MRINSHTCVPAVIAGSLAIAAGCGAPNDPVPLAELGQAKQALSGPESFTPKTAAAHTGRLAGVAVAYDPLVNDPTYADIVASEFSDITPENATKWGPLQPAPREWDFTRADVIVDFAEQSSMRVKGHALAWHSQMPDFITPDIQRRKLKKALTRHIKRTVRHFRRDLFAWDVVNEAIADDGSGLRDSVLSQKLGDRWIRRAFRTAAAKDRHAKLYYNDYNIATINPKSDAVYDLMVDLLRKRVPVDGVGMQGHIDARFAPSYEALVENFERFGALGLSVNISELDVRIANIGGSEAHRLAVQKQIYHRVSAACVAVEACEGVTTWGFTDAYSWIDSTFGADDPLLFDEQYNKKPAYYGYVDGFLGVPLDTSASMPNLVGNSSLEAGLDGWSQQGGSAIAVETTRSNTGLRSVVHSGRTANWNGPRYDMTSLSEAGRSYDVSVAASIAGAASAPLGLSAAITCAGEGTRFVNLASAPGSDEEFVELAGELQLPLCDLQSVAVYVEGPDGGIDILADDLAIRQQPLGNVVPNPDFEAGTAGWFGWGPATVGVTTDARSGSQAGIASGRTDSWQGIATNLTAEVLPGGAYVGGAWVKIAGAASADVHLTMKTRCAGEGDSYTRVGTTTANDASYVEVAGSLLIPACDLEEVTLYAEGPAGGIDILLDDVVFSLQVSEPQANLLGNGEFEGSTSGWFPFGPTTIATTSAQAHGGAESALVSGRTDTWQGMATDLAGVVQPGSSYPLQAFARLSSGTSNVSMTLALTCDGGSTSYSQAATASANDSSWTELNGNVAIPATCSTVDTAYLYIEGAPAGVDIYLDDVTLTE